jgi:hypothetical protein
VQPGVVFAVASLFLIAPAVARADAPSPGAVEWTVTSPALAPPSRSDFAFAHDAARGETILFGGRGAAAVLGDTWAWNGARWLDENPSAAPSARSGHAMVFDAARGKMVLFGGAPCVSGCASLGDTWTYDGKAWTQLAPAMAPTPRTVAAMAYDAVRRKVVLFGGCSDLFNCRFTVLDDTWEWDGTAWTPNTVAVSPPPAYASSLAFDGAGIVLYGGNGQGPPGPPHPLAATWRYDGATWTKASTPAAPSPRALAPVAYDSVRKRVVLYGGQACSNSLCSGYQETWEWDGVAWHEGSPALVSTAAVVAGGLAFDVTRRRTVLARSDDAGSMVVWELLGYGESCTSDAACDTSSCNGGICCKVACGACSDCDSTGTRCVPVRSKDDTESCSGTMTCNEIAECKSKLGRACAAAAECASGLCTGGVCCSVESCGGFACDATGSCLVSCSGDAECAPGNTCVTGHCARSKVTCEGDVAVDVATGARTACAPYACGVAGCLSACANTDECAAGALCDAHQACVVTPAANDGSCSLASSAESRVLSRTGLAGLFGLALLVARRARRRETSR